ncbi:MAG: DUF4097 family beta strand repeat-containing protein [Chitinophagaceae bacterium]
MKQTNPVLLLMICLASFCSLHAQEHKINVLNSKDGKLTLNNFCNDLSIEGYSGNEIIIVSSLPAETPEKAKGLKSVYARGTDNTGIGLEVEKNGSHVILQYLLAPTKGATYKIKVPDNFSIEIATECKYLGDVSVSNIKGEVAIKNCRNITAKNIQGPLVLSTTAGSINVHFAALTKGNPVSLASIGGEIDVTVPATSAMDVELKSFTGTIYSDFSFPDDKKSSKKVGGSNISSKLNGGGTSVTITNTTGNIYLRKG